MTTDQFTITADETINFIQIFDLMGKEVYNKAFSSAQKEAEIGIDQGFNGIYFVKATFSNNENTTQKILIR
ncbi:MAG: T9SS type A sorting domain-containing protein [Bacteroidales bacterium]